MPPHAPLISRRAALGLLAAPALLKAADDFPRLLENFVRPLGGELGFAMHHVESGERIAVRGEERFAMASVYKLPIAIAILREVDVGKIALDDSIRLTPADLRLGLGNNQVEKLVGTEGHSFSVGELLRRILVDSDNASSDALLKLLTPAKVSSHLATLGISGIRVDRPELELLLDFIGAPTHEPEGGWTLAHMRERYNSATAVQRSRALAAFYQDPRDTATPNAMLELLLRVHRRTLLKPRGGALLVDLLGQCQTGSKRLRGNLPENVAFLHRTGTSDSTDGITAATNDAGILTLPGDRGHVIIVAFLRGCRGSMGDRELALAHIGRAVYERYVGA